MNRRRAARPAVIAGAVVVVVVAALATWGWATSVYPDPPQPTPDRKDARFFSGFFSEGQPLALEYRSIPDGQYVLEYRFDARLSAHDPAVTLDCGFIDSNGTIGYLENSDRVAIPATGKTRSVEYAGAFQLPEITVALTCTPSASGELTVQFSDIVVSIATVE